MADGERRFSCNVHVYLFYEPRKKTAIRMLLPSSARLSCGKDQPMCLRFLDESLAWVLRKSLFYECTPSACNSPLAFAILRRSARSIPRFRADFLPFTSQIVEHSRYLPSVSPLSNQGIPLRQVIYPMHIMPRPSGRGKPPFTKILCFALEEVGNNLRLFFSHKMPATSHYLCDHVAAAKLFG